MRSFRLFQVQKGLRLFQQEAVDLVLLDIMLGGKNGTRSLRRSVCTVRHRPSWWPPLGDKHLISQYLLQVPMIILLSLIWTKWCLGDGAVEKSTDLVGTGSFNRRTSYPYEFGLKSRNPWIGVREQTPAWEAKRALTFWDLLPSSKIFNKRRIVWGSKLVCSRQYPQ